MELHLYPIRSLSESIVTIPDYQRESVWNLSKQRGFIDTILRGLHMPPIILVEVKNPLGTTQFMILDGQQRYNTIIDYKNNKFKTAKRLSSTSLKPVCSNMFFNQLPEHAKIDFLEYAIPMVKIKDLGYLEQGELFRRLQIQEKLTLGEILYSLNTEHNHILEEIMDYVYFGLFYKRKTNRKEQFQIALIFLALEKHYKDKSGSPYLNLTTSTKKNLVRNIDGNDTSLIPIIKKRLDGIMRLYNGLSYTSISESIFLYQSMLMLEQSNVNINNCKEGSLSKWFLELHNYYSQGRYGEKGNNGEDISIYQLDQTYRQIKFWAKNWFEMLNQDGIVILDRKRAFDNPIKTKKYIEQSGKCSLCGKEFKGIENSYAHHIKPYANGGKTELENCQLLCKDCHAIKHGYKESN